MSAFEDGQILNIWDDIVGDSCEAPENDEIVKFAQEIERKVRAVIDLEIMRACNKFEREHIRYPNAGAINAFMDAANIAKEG